MAIGPTNGDLAEVINKTNAGTIVDFDDKRALKTALLADYKLFKNSKLKSESKYIADYHVKNICAKLADVIKS